MLDWQGKEFILVVAEGRDGSQPYPAVTNQYILSASVEATNKLLFEVGSWSNELHGEIWVFDGGYWQKSAALYEGMIKASWDNVIMEEKTKKSIRADVLNFFDGRDTYTKLKVPWKRGVIYYGPPGNGKTISIKAMMHELHERKDTVPTLYVKSLASFAGPEYSINQIFNRARQTAPCYLVFEDLDSLVTDQVRSYFLNAVDGIQNNDGILMVGSTNHLDRLDPGIAKRPSRFDRKYKFANPNEAERILYMNFWQRKLADNKDIEFPDKLCPAIAKITQGFSFAYLQEAMIASLLAIARRDAVDDDDQEGAPLCLECMEHHGWPYEGTCEREGSRPFPGSYNWVWMVRRVDETDPGLDKYVLWREVKKQVRILREELGEGKGDDDK
nr:putative atpase yjob [Quercus suber]